MLHPERRRESIRQIAYEEGFHDGYAQALSEMPEIVRCKDCRFYLGKGFCNRSGIHLEVNDNWFCADGTRKECDPV